jgi:hypothetical protein
MLRDRADQCVRSGGDAGADCLHDHGLQDAVYLSPHAVIFNVFDLLSLNSLKFADLILMFKSIVRAYAYLTAQPLPDVHTLEKYAQTVFSRADLNNDQNLQLSE